MAVLIRCLAGVVAFAALGFAASADEGIEDVYQTADAFLAEAFDGTAPEPELLWITRALRPTVTDIMGHRMAGLRIRYWRRDARTAWILEEIGKVQPITTGFVIDNGRLAQIEVLIYRESRGWEVRYPFFTDQFNGAALNGDHRLDRGIDGISGATLSVNALVRLSRLALFLDRVARDDGG